MLRHDFDEPVNRVNTDSFKWDYEGESGKYLPLGVADTDFKSPVPAIEKLKEKVDFGVYAYGYLPQKRFSACISRWYEKRHGVRIPEESVRHSQGLMTGALWMILDAYTRPGDRIIIQPPVYNTFKVVIEGAGRFLANNDLKLIDSKYQIDYDDLEEKCRDPRNRMLLICNPANPVGRAWTKEELTTIFTICQKYGVLVVSDDIHADLVYNNNRYTPLFSVSEEARENVIVMSSPSKTFNLASFYSAYVIIHNDYYRKQYEVVYDKYHFDYNYFGIEALITCYDDCEYYVEQQNSYILENMKFFKTFCDEKMPMIKVTIPESTYLLWVNMKELGLNNQEIIELFSRHGVKLNNGLNYGNPGEGFVRINMATQRANVEKALQMMEAAYKSL